MVSMRLIEYARCLVFKVKNRPKGYYSDDLTNTNTNIKCTRLILIWCTNKCTR